MTKLIPCEDYEATHAQVLPCEYGRCELMDVIPYAIYEILRCLDPGSEGEEMLVNELGEYCASFSIVVKVRWLKEVDVNDE